MIYLLYVLLLVMVVTILFLNKPNKKNYLFTLLITFIIFFFVFNPQLVINSAKKGAILFFNSVFPTLFPFLVCLEFLVAYGGIEIYSSLFGKILSKPLRLSSNCSFPLIVSFICGYPLGAKASITLYDNNDINETTLSRLLNIASNAGPLFIVGSIATTMLNCPKLGLILLISNYLSPLIMSIIIPAPKHCIDTNYSLNPTNKIHKNFGEILKEALDNSLKTSLSVGSFIIIFSVIINLLNSNILFNNLIKMICCIFPKLDLNIVKGLLLGLIEITNGCYILSISNITPIIKYSLISFLCGFSGFSIICQVYSFTYKVKSLSIMKYTARKFIQGIIGFIITYIALKFFPIDIYTFSSFTLPINNFALPSIALLILSLISIFMLYLKNLFHSS